MHTRRLVGVTVGFWMVLAGTAQAAVSPEQAGSIGMKLAAGQSESMSVAPISEEINRISPTEAFYQVTMHGHFVDQEAPTPAGAPAPSGTLMEVLVDRETGDVRMVHVGTTPQPVAGIEPQDSSGLARTSRLPGLRKARARGRAHTATWGTHCKIANNNHCYSIANWYMTGSGNGGGEEVEGAVVETNTTSMNIPEWNVGAIVTNELWVDFHPSGYWAEIGTISGYYIGSCCALRWFYAKENANGFTIWPQPNGVITPNTWPWYWLIAEGGGGWCWKIGEHGEATVACEGGYTTYSNWLQDGAEAASESEPTNAGKVVTSYEARNGGWHTWNTAESFVDVRMCQSQFQPYPGNINYGTC
jgi:hypothetical protein